MKRVLLAFILIAAFSGLAAAQAGQYVFYFPQVTSGTYPGGSWTTTIFLTNAAGDRVANGTLAFTRSDGAPYNIAFLDDVGRSVGSGNKIFVQLNPGETRKYVSVANEPLNRGFATITANAALLGTAMFTQFNGAGQMIGEAGVPLSIPLGKQAIFVDTTSGFKTAFAIANPQNAVLEIHFELINTVGRMEQSVVRPLGPFQQTAMFVNELFPNMGGMVGRLQFYCTNPMTAVGLRFDKNFALFTTLPPIAVE